MVTIRLKRNKKFSANAWSEAAYQSLIKFWDEAISEYIKAVAAIVGQYQDTGMSYASVFPAMARFNATGPGLSPEKAQRKFYTTIGGIKHRDTFKTSALGETLGAKSAQVGYGTKGYPRFFFRFEIAVFQFLHNDKGTKNFPYHFRALKAGREAFLNYVKQHRRNAIPKFEKYFTATKE